MRRSASSAPAIERMRARTACAEGPFRPIPCSCRSILSSFDAVLAMYHDQGLPVLSTQASARGERHARPALRPHLGRPRHGAGPGRHRPRRRRQPRRGDRARGRARRAATVARAAARRDPAATAASASASTSCTTRRSSRASSHALGARPGRPPGRDRPRPRRAHPPAAGTRGRDARCDRDRPRPRRARCAPLRARPRLALHEATPSTSTLHALARTRGGRLRVIGNLPYNISTPLLFQLLGRGDVDHRPALHAAAGGGGAHGRAAPGGDDYGRLTVMLAPLFEHRARCSRWVRALPAAAAGLVGGGAPAARAAPPSRSAPQFAPLVAAAFGQRRKTLRNALARPDRAMRSRPAASTPARGRDAGARGFRPPRARPGRSGRRCAFDADRQRSGERHGRLPSHPAGRGPKRTARHRPAAHAHSQRARRRARLLHVVEFVPVEPIGETLMPPCRSRMS